MSKIEQIADKLETGASADIWYDADDYGAQSAAELIEETQNAMEEAARVLRQRAFIHEVQMQDIVGDYEIPDEAPEWAWIEDNASYKHVHNGERDGIWEFILNLNLELANPPEQLSPIIAEAREMGAMFLLIHQGT